MSNSLFKISADLQMIVNHLIENGGELTPETENSLMIKESELKQKVVDYATVIRSLEYDNAIIDEEIKRLQHMKKTRANAVDRLKNAVSDAMQSFNIPEVETATAKINFRKSESVEVLDEELIPKEYKRTVVKTAPDKTAIKKALKSGEQIPGCELLTNQNLQIK